MCTALDSQLHVPWLVLIAVDEGGIRDDAVFPSGSGRFQPALSVPTALWNPELTDIDDSRGVQNSTR
jgi:hypothetical protein